MANALGNYDPIFYATEVLIWLKKSLGLAGRVHRGYDKAPQEKGSVISIRRPHVRTASAMPISSGVDLTPDTVTITLDQWWGDLMGLTDKELAATKDQVIQEHIQPMAYAIADKIDSTLAVLYKDVPWYVVNTSPCAVADITAVQRVMFANQVPEDEGQRHLMLSGIQREEFLNLAAFAQSSGAGVAGVETQLRGSLGIKYGYETFANQNVQTHTAGVCADVAGALVGDHAKGVTTLVFDAVTAAGTLVAGDTLVITGNSQRYAVTANATATGGGEITVTITPPLVAAALDNAVVTAVLVSGEQGLAFHRGAFALAMGVLPDNIPGTSVFTAVDPVTGLSVRARHFYVGLEAKQYIGVDALWGVKTLNPNLACRLSN
jgi:hypothetical protein